jgi:hypothetical protein
MLELLMIVLAGRVEVFVPVGKVTTAAFVVLVAGIVAVVGWFVVVLTGKLDALTLAGKTAVVAGTTASSCFFRKEK